MLKLMKYEFRKQMFSKIAMLTIMLCLEVYFFYGVIFSKDNVAATATMFLCVFAFICILFVSFECIFTFKNDLKTKQSYMLFLVPKSTYSVMGAKVLSSVIQILLTGVLFVVVAIADVFAIFAKFGEIEDFVKHLQKMMQEIFVINVNTERILWVLSSMIVTWIFIVVVSMFSITLSTTFLANSKVSGVVSFVLFLAITSVVSKISNQLNDGIFSATSEFAVTIAFYLVLSVVMYLGTAWMLDKKVGV